MLKVGFGVTALARGLAGDGVDGIGHYTQSLLECMQPQTSLNISPFSFGIETKKSDFNTPVLLRDNLSKELIKGAFIPKKRFCRNMTAPRLDLVHATDHLIPFSKDVPLLATVMDAIPLSHPEWVRAGRLGKLKAELWKKMAQRSDHIVTISDYSKAQIMKYFAIDEAKISVVPLGVDKRFFDVIEMDEKKSILDKYDIKKPFALSIGTLQPRKNLESSLAAMQLLPKHLRESHQFIIVGRQGWASDELIASIKKAEQEGWCKWLNYVTDFELRAMLQSASLLLFPSLAEGFGLPILEAFASKAPVVASNTTSIPEVAKDCALLVNPLEASEIALAMEKILEDKSLAQQLSQQGFARAQEMSWQQCAIETEKVYRKIV